MNAIHFSSPASARMLFAALAAFFFLSNTANATTYYLKGNTYGNWENSCNWYTNPLDPNGSDCNGYPGIFDVAYMNSHSSATLTQPTVVGTLIMSGFGSVNGNFPFTVLDDATLYSNNGISVNNKVHIQGNLHFWGGTVGGTDSAFVHGLTYFHQNAGISKPLVMLGGGQWLAYHIGLSTSDGFLINPPGAVFTIHNTAAGVACNYDSGGEFKNYGTVIKDTQHNVTFNSPASMTGGEMHLLAGLTTFMNNFPCTNSELNVSDGAKLDFNNGARVFTNSSLHSAGYVKMKNTDIFNVGCSVSFDTLYCYGSGGPAFHIPVTVPNLIMAGGGAYFYDLLTITGSFWWINGHFYGGAIINCLPLAHLVEDGGSASYTSCKFNFIGGAEWTSGNYVINGGGGQFNFPDGADFLVNLSSTLQIATSGTTPYGEINLSPNSILTKTGAGKAVLEVVFNSDESQILVQQGGLDIWRGTHDDSYFQIASGNVLQCTQNGIFFYRSEITGLGILRETGFYSIIDSSTTLDCHLEMTGGDLHVRCPITPLSLKMTGGELRGTGLITVAGDCNWTGPAIITGTGLIDVQGFTTISGSGARTFYKEIKMNGGGSWGGTFSLAFGTTGIIRVPVGANLTVSPTTTINNSGTQSATCGIIVEGSLAKTTNFEFDFVGADFTNNGSVHGIGSFRTANNTFVHPNTGALSPGITGTPGALTWIGHFENKSAGHLIFDFLEQNGDVFHDQMHFTNNLLIGGTLTVNGADPNWPNDTFDLISWAGTRTGSFATVNLPDDYELIVDDVAKKIRLGHVQPTFDSELSGSQTTCAGTPANLVVTIAGGTSPYTLVISDGTNSTTIPDYLSGENIPVSPTAPATTFSLSSVEDAASVSGATSGTATVQVDAATVGGTVGNSQTICTGSTPATLNLTGQMGAILKWQSSPDGSTWDDISNTTTTHSPDVLTMTTHYRAVIQNGVCSVENSTAAIITVNENTMPGTVGNSQTICTGSAPATLNLTGQMGAILKWQSSPDGTSWTDISNTSASYSPPAQTSSKHFRAIVNNADCGEAPSTAALISVDALSAGGTVSPSQTICSGTTPYQLMLQNQFGTVQKWQWSPDGSAWNDIVCGAAIYSPGPLTATKKYRAVVQNGVCLAANSTQATITVIAPPVPTMPDFAPVCVNAAPISLNGSPAGGTYSGVGVSGSTFTPSSAGVGSHAVTYTFTNGEGCTGSVTKTIIVNALPTVSLASFTAVCLNSPEFALTGGLPTGGLYSGPGVSGGNFNPATAGAGTKTITYFFTDGNGCAASTSKPITVNGLPEAGLAPQPTVCTTAQPFALTGGTPTGGTWSGNGVSGGIFNPTVAGQGLHVITYTATNANGCTGTATQYLNVSGSCSTTCTIVTCPPARNVNMTAACKIVIPNLVSEAVVGGDCNSPAAVSQSPAAGLLLAATHNIAQNVVITVVDAAGITTVCTVMLTPKDVTGPIITNCSATPTNATMSATTCKISISNFATMTTTTDCSGPVTKTQVPAANSQFVAVHNQSFTVVITATDAAGNSTTCTRTVVAKDMAKPAISTCPPAQTIGLNASCQLLVPDKTGQIVATDGCSNPLTKTQNPAPGTLLSSAPGMQHTVIFSVTDAANNTKTCSVILIAGACGTMLAGQDSDPVGNETQAVKYPVSEEKTNESDPNRAENRLDMQTMPNPFSNELTITFDLSAAGKMNLVLLDLTGQTHFSEHENRLETGRQTMVLNTEDLPAGAYFVGLQTGENGWTWRKVMLVR